MSDKRRKSSRSKRRQSKKGSRRRSLLKKSVKRRVSSRRKKSRQVSPRRRSVKRGISSTLRASSRRRSRKKSYDIPTDVETIVSSGPEKVINPNTYTLPSFGVSSGISSGVSPGILSEVSVSTKNKAKDLIKTAEIERDAKIKAKIEEGVKKIKQKKLLKSVLQAASTIKETREQEKIAKELEELNIKKAEAAKIEEETRRAKEEAEEEAVLQERLIKEALTATEQEEALEAKKKAEAEAEMYRIKLEKLQKDSETTNANEATLRKELEQAKKEKEETMLRLEQENSRRIKELEEMIVKLSQKSSEKQTEEPQNRLIKSTVSLLNKLSSNRKSGVRSSIQKKKVSEGKVKLDTQIKKSNELRRAKEKADAEIALLRQKEIDAQKEKEKYARELAEQTKRLEEAKSQEEKQKQEEIIQKQKLKIERNNKFMEKARKLKKEIEENAKLKEAELEKSKQDIEQQQQTLRLLESELKKNTEETLANLAHAEEINREQEAMIRINTASKHVIKSKKFIPSIKTEALDAEKTGSSSYVLQNILNNRIVQSVYRYFPSFGNNQDFNSDIKNILMYQRLAKLGNKFPDSRRDVEAMVIRESKEVNKIKNITFLEIIIKTPKNYENDETYMQYIVNQLANAKILITLKKNSVQYQGFFVHSMIKNNNWVLYIAVPDSITATNISVIWNTTPEVSNTWESFIGKSAIELPIVLSTKVVAKTSINLDKSIKAKKSILLPEKDGVTVYISSKTPNFSRIEAEAENKFSDPTIIMVPPEDLKYYTGQVGDLTKGPVFFVNGLKRSQNLLAISYPTSSRQTSSIKNIGRGLSSISSTFGTGIGKLSSNLSSLVISPFTKQALQQFFYIKLAPPKGVKSIEYATHIREKFSNIGTPYIEVRERREIVDVHATFIGLKTYDNKMWELYFKLEKAIAPNNLFNENLQLNTDIKRSSTKKLSMDKKIHWANNIDVTEENKDILTPKISQIKDIKITPEKTIETIVQYASILDIFMEKYSDTTCVVSGTAEEILSGSLDPFLIWNDDGEFRPNENLWKKISVCNRDNILFILLKICSNKIVSNIVIYNKTNKSLITISYLSEDLSCENKTINLLGNIFTEKTKYEVKRKQTLGSCPLIHGQISDKDKELICNMWPVYYADTYLSNNGIDIEKKISEENRVGDFVHHITLNELTKRLDSEVYNNTIKYLKTNLTQLQLNNNIDFLIIKRKNTDIQKITDTLTDHYTIKIINVTDYNSSIICQTLIMSNDCLFPIIVINDKDSDRVNNDIIEDLKTKFGDNASFVNFTAIIPKVITKDSPEIVIDSEMISNDEKTPYIVNSEKELEDLGMDYGSTEPLIMLDVNETIMRKNIVNNEERIKFLINVYNNQTTHFDALKDAITEEHIDYQINEYETEKPDESQLQDLIRYYIQGIRHKAAESKNMSKAIDESVMNF